MKLIRFITNKLIYSTHNIKYTDVACTQNINIDYRMYDLCFSLKNVH